MFRSLSAVFLLSCYAVIPATAQIEKAYIKNSINELSAVKMQGRGYAGRGDSKAAAYIRREFREDGLLEFEGTKNYYQRYTMPINTFPTEVYLKINNKELVPGIDYLVHAASRGYKGEDVPLVKINLAEVKDSTAWQKVKKNFKTGEAYLLENYDTLDKYVKPGLRGFAKELPDNLFIAEKHGKLTWIACMDTVAGTVLYVEDSVMPKKVKTATVDIETKYIPEYTTQNVMGYVKGTEQPDSFIVFSAHYDHLGKMGRHTIFPGAHDNASGTSLVLYLANYFAQHPQKYSIAFMLFSGEEAGLMGSKHYASHPVFDLKQIRFVVNLDMTGDATNGITVVNGTEQTRAFEMLEKLNGDKKYVPDIKKRDQTKNSDHYSFSEAGVPAIFIYGNGTKPFYHDVFDVADEISLENIDKLADLLIEFTGTY